MVIRSYKSRKSGSKKSRSADKKNHNHNDNVSTGPKYGFFQKMSNAIKRQSIFKGDTVVIRPGQRIDDPFEMLVAYAISRYRQEFDSVRDQCTFNTNLKTSEQVFKQQITWFVYARIRPATGITIAKEFVQNNDVPKELAKVFLQTTKLFSDHFKVIKHNKRDIVVYGMRKRKEYNVVSNNPSMYPIGCMIEGHIHPYYGKYKFCGITTATMF